MIVVVVSADRTESFLNMPHASVIPPPLWRRVGLGQDYLCGVENIDTYGQRGWGVYRYNLDFAPVCVERVSEVSVRVC